MACHKDCKYKYNRSSADIRIGDLWGKTYKDNEEGVSALVSFTPKGEKAIALLVDNCTLTEHPFEVVAEGQMKRNCGRSKVTRLTISMLKSNIPLRFSFWILRVLNKLVR